MVLVEELNAHHTKIHHLDQLQGLWRKDSKWFLDMKRLNGGVPVEFDGYMRELVDRGSSSRGREGSRCSFDFFSMIRH
jgi:hypothetical protein